MARGKEYDRDEVLKRALEIFWEKGYESTSVQDLVSCTGLNTFSMYREFGNKERFFILVMELYYRSVLEKMLAILRESPGRTGLVAFLDSFPGPVASKNYRGCLFMNTLTEKETISPLIRARVEEFCVELTGMIKKSLVIAQRASEIAFDKNPATLANLIFCFVQGLTLYGRISVDEKAIRGMVEAVKHAAFDS
jgi:TetR/AcrR family transcriptional repressor of nem operon